MELKATFIKAATTVRKYKHAFIVVIIGIILLLIPKYVSFGENNGNTTKEIPSTTPSVEQRLTEILSKIAGVGEVKVLLTEKVGAQTIYQTDRNTTTDSDLQKEDKTTVIISDSDRNQEAIICQINPPQYLGAIIICRGGDDPAAELAIIDAVKKATGLGANQISVLKMM